MEAMRTSGHERAGVVCAALGGGDDDRAALLAGSLARRLGWPLTVADVREPIAPASHVTGGSYAVPPVPGAGLTSPPADLDRLVEIAGVGARRARVDAPRHEALRRLACDPATGILVVRDDGGGPVVAGLASGTARAITREASSPVVLVPDVDASLPVGDTAIVCAVDTGPVADRVVALAGDLTAALGATLHVLHAGVGDRLGELVERWRRLLPPALPADFRHVAGPPPQALRDLAADVGARLVVMGRPDHGALLSVILGSVVHAMLRKPVAPLVVVPDAEHASRGR
jgi:nucleotide-binding universal stress UspA family protein